jgi:hypothetical protein
VLLTVDLVGDGGILAARGGVLEVSESTLLDGLSTGRGGQIFAEDATVRLADTTLVGGFARFGGAVAIAASLPVEVSVVGCRFEQSTAVDDGGAISVTGPVELRVSESRFLTNRARRGGAIASDEDPGAVVEVSGSTFEDQEASEDGGALHLGAGRVRVDGSAFLANRAEQGGAIALRGSGEAAIERSLGCDNEAASGGVMWLSVPTGSATVANDRWIRNRATGAGGAVFVAEGSVALVHQNLLANVAPSGAAVEALPSASSSLEYSLVAFNEGSSPFRGSSISEARNLFFSNAGLLPVLDPSDLRGDPLLRAFDDRAPCGSIDDGYSYHGPLRDPYAATAGSGEPTDLDGSPPDIGAYGGPGSDPAAWADQDRDGQPGLLDCDDDNPGVFPTPDASNEVWYDGVDQDCDGRDTDEDGDGVALPLDCDDQDATILPGAREESGSGDMDCDGLADADHDGFEPPEDCADDDPRIHPGATEDLDPAVDLDCDGIGDPPGSLVWTSCATHGEPGGLPAVLLAAAAAASRRRYWPRRAFNALPTRK